MTICWVPAQTLLRHALWMIKGSVRIDSDSPQEARRGINKPPSTDPFSLQFGPFDSLTGRPSSHTVKARESKTMQYTHNNPALQNAKLLAKQQHT